MIANQCFKELKQMNWSIMQIKLQKEWRKIKL